MFSTAWLTSCSSRRGTAIFSPGVGLGLSPVREGDYNSTCSILDASDLSFDNTQGSVLGGHDDSKLRSAWRLVARFDLDKCLKVTLYRSGRTYKRKSSGAGSALAAARQEKRSRGSQGPRKSLEAMAARRWVWSGEGKY